MVAKPIGERFDEARPITRPGLVKGPFHHVTHRNDVIAVYLFTRHANRKGFVSQGWCGCLGVPRDRDRPLIVVDDENRRKAPYRCDINRFVEVPF